jgi:hypothetical protein
MEGIKISKLNDFLIVSHEDLTRDVVSTRSTKIQIHLNTKGERMGDF